MTPASSTKSDSALARRARLFSLLKTATDRGARLSRISDVDDHVRNARPAIHVKHDVHGLSLDALVEFAAGECQLGLLGSYFFMTPEHPVTRSHYSFDQQLAAMRSLQNIGHEIGLHLDPIGLIQESSRPLRQLITEVLALFAPEGFAIRIGNVHGNTAQPMRDRNGHTSTFEFFEELARQPDFPALANLPAQSAGLVRTHRCSIVDLGFTHWADMPMWSQQSRYVVTHFISDNQLAKKGTLKFATLPDTVGRYKLMDTHPPRARMPGTVRQFVTCDAGPNDELPIGSFDVPLNDGECEVWFKHLANQPALLLIHPEHYC